MPDTPEPQDTTGEPPAAAQIPSRDAEDEQVPIEEQLTDDLSVQGGE
jgi:hypothetical protein